MAGRFFDDPGPREQTGLLQDGDQHAIELGTLEHVEIPHSDSGDAVTFQPSVVTHRARPYEDHVEKCWDLPLQLVRHELKIEKPTSILINAADLEGKDTCFNKFMGCVRSMVGMGYQRDVSLFWSEKVIILINFLQLFALFRSVSPAWPWPSWFSSKTLWCVWFNLDVAFYYADPVYGDFNYVPYVAIWLFVPLIIYLFYFIIQYVFKDNIEKLRKMEKTILVISEVLYMPYVLACFRLFMCSSSSFSQIDSTLGAQCWNVNHLVLLACTMVSGALYVVFLPLYMWRLIKDQAVYLATADHELYLQGKEAEYLLNLDNFWENNRFFLFSSFTRRWIWYRMFLMVRKLVLVVLVVALASVPQYQSAIIFFLLIISLFCLELLYAMPYRDALSNAMMQLLGWCNVLNILFGWLATQNIQSPFFVDQIQTFWLLALNCSCVGFFVLLTIYAAVIGRQWKVTPDKIAKEMELFSYHVPCIVVARELTRKARSSLPEFVRTDILGAHIDVLNSVWGESKREGLSLQKTIEDVLEDLVDAYNKVKPASLLNENSKELEETLKGLRTRMNQRRIDFMLIGETRRVLLMRLLALRLFLLNNDNQIIPKDYQAIEEGRESAPTYEDRDSWDGSVKSIGGEYGNDNFSSDEDEYGAYDDSDRSASDYSGDDRGPDRPSTRGSDVDPFPQRPGSTPHSEPTDREHFL
eukprot:gnl/Spiro4/21398_TR10464_c0_g2_i1.p1 gnl/Spiro4/21398_TR10464_c0_g2~~gnl/Spiro4/21398_TR10464_c0_g2_i1.p1  ORF type:complete len:696 (-),score=248.60 gnl/Spiro4/21398_TR10464_c0_g2_i1:77-2164(-)